jgi:diguanylate cyclase (GGDEF)-like protein/PAS domain S-box-containing protein
LIKEKKKREKNCQGGVAEISDKAWWQALVESEKRYRQLFDEAPLGYQSLDANGYFVEVNQKWLEILGYQREEVVGKWFGDFLQPEGQELFKKCFPVFKEKGQIHGEFEMRHHDGSRRYIDFEGRIGYDEKGQVRQTHCILQDVTVRRENEKNREKERKEAMYLIYHDQLTGLYNRRYYDQVLKKMDQPANLPLSILMGDVNGLKRTNDIFGHKQGDELIKMAAKIIALGCRTEDVIARIGGDEFVVILPRVDHEGASRIVNRIRELSREFSINGVHVSIAFGQGTKYQEDEAIAEVFKTAEAEMYRQKIREHREQEKGIIRLFYDLFEEIPELEEIPDEG